VLEEHHRLSARPCLEGGAHGVGDEPQRILERAGRACARMDDDAEEAKGVCASPKASIDIRRSTGSVVARLIR
jgi:hypothetical protein